jgi:hypothetical protein
MLAGGTTPIRRSQGQDVSNIRSEYKRALPGFSMKIRFGLRSRGQRDMWRAPACQPRRHAASSAGVHFGFPQRARAAMVPSKRRSRLFHRFMRVLTLAAPPRRPISRIHSSPLGVWFAMLHRYPIIFYVSKRPRSDTEAIVPLIVRGCLFRPDKQVGFTVKHSATKMHSWTGLKQSPSAIPDECSNVSRRGLRKTLKLGIKSSLVRYQRS